MSEGSADERPASGNRLSGEAFFVGPPGGGKGPGVLILHSWWGLTDWVKDFATRVADEGYTVLAPDLMGGATPVTAEEGETVLGALNPDELSSLVLSSAQVVQNASAGDEEPMAVIGLSMGASMAFWLSARLPDAVSAVVTFYGAQSIDFDSANAVYQGHFAENDHLVSEEDRVVTESFIRLGDNQTEFHLYPGTEHWFFEPGDSYHPEAAEHAWERTVDFLARNLGSMSEPEPSS